METSTDFDVNPSGKARTRLAGEVHVGTPEWMNVRAAPAVVQKLKRYRSALLLFPEVCFQYLRNFGGSREDLVGVTVATFIAGLESGLAYANIHDAEFPGGEIRGQLSQVPLPGALPLFATGLGALGLLGWRRKKRQAV